VKYNGVINISYGADIVNPEPVLLSDAKTFLRVSNTVEDALITQLITSARQQAEKYTGIYLKPRNIIAMVNCGIGLAEIPGPVYSPITWLNPPAGNTPPVTLYNSSLTFISSTSATLAGITGVVPIIGSINFQFSLITPRTGMNYTMNLNYNGVLVMTVTFPSDYLLQEFQYTDASGQVYKANFTNGTIDLLYNEFSVQGLNITGGIFKSLVDPSDSTIRLSYQVGYTACPEDIKSAILNQVAFMYQNRGDDLKVGSISSMFLSTLSMYKRQWI